jgi:hypothetical protein
MVMNKTIIALAALFASAICAPAAQAHCDAEEIAEGECARGIRMPGFGQLLPPAARSSAAAKDQCDADDAAELKECLQAMKAHSARQPSPQGARSVAETPTREAPDRTAAAPPDTTVASTEKSAKPDEAPLCQRYFPNIGQSMSVPCND